MNLREQVRDRVKGCMLGAAIGDALGKQNEGRARRNILKKGYVTDYGKSPSGSPGEFLRPGQYTDDTEQMLILAQSLIECRGFHGGDFASRIAKWGISILADPRKISLLGPASSPAIMRLHSGVPWRDAGSDTPSCGAAMRVAPIGLFYQDPDDVEHNAALSSLPTHSSQEAKAGAVGVAVGVRCGLSDMDCAGMMRETSFRASKYDAALGGKIEHSFKKRHASPERVFPELGTSYFVYETVPSAFYCFSRYFDEPEKAVIEAVNAGGDTDSIACITGALCGARHGIGAFPEKWIQGLEGRGVVEHIAELLFEKSAFNYGNDQS